MSSRPPGGMSPQAASLGPHVVGERVVVRRLLRGETGPTGGPAFIDLLGTCLSWGDGECVVAPESGEPVRIALADIVSGKPVPPRPSVRHRVPTREAEVRGLRMFPGTQHSAAGCRLLIIHRRFRSIALGDLPVAPQNGLALLHRSNHLCEWSMRAILRP